MNPIQSVKNQRNEDVTYAGADVNNVYNLAVGVAVGAATNTINIPTGSHVYSFDVSVNYINSSASINTTYSWMIVKFRQGQTTGSEFATPSGSSWTNIGLSNARNQIIKSFMGASPPSIGGGTKNNFHVPVPKMMQRMREGDVVSLVFNATEAGLLSIGSRYKYYM